MARRPATTPVGSEVGPISTVRARLSAESFPQAPDLMSGPDWHLLVRSLGLSRREAEVLRASFYDDRVASIAARLGLAESTVHTYRQRLFAKLGISRCTQLLAVVFSAYLQMERVRPTPARNDGSMPSSTSEMTPRS